MKENKITLNSIAERYSDVHYNSNVYNLGGGITSNKFVSNRHEDAINDSGKLTIGEVIQLFKKATGLPSQTIRDVINFVFPSLEYHHSGFYGKKMGKTYFLNSEQIVKLADNWDKFLNDMNKGKHEYEQWEEQQREKDRLYYKKIEESKELTKNMTPKEYDVFLSDLLKTIHGECWLNKFKETKII